MHTSCSVLSLVLLISIMMADGAEKPGHPHDSAVPRRTPVPFHNGRDTVCPTWYTQVNESGDIWCTCNDKMVQRGYVVKCPKKDRICMTCGDQQTIGRDDFNVSILMGYCMTHNFSSRQSLLAACPYNSHPSNSDDFMVMLPSSLSELNDYMCLNFQREGDLCSSCINDTGPSLFGRTGMCFFIENSALTWFYFLSLELVPPTAVFCIVLFCRIRATTGPLNAFIFFCQMFYTVTALQRQAVTKSFGVIDSNEWRSAAEGAKSIFLDAIGSFYTFWDNQYAFTIQSTVTASLSSMQMVAIQYLPALYPLFLIVLSYVVIRLHYNGCRLLIYAWRPFQYCKARLGINWDPMDSIVHTFATFVLLVYTKIIEVSYNLLAPSRVYTESGELPYKVMPYDASIRFLSLQHLPYVILALSMLSTLCGLPVLVLLLYPMACFQKFLTKTTSPHFRQMLRTFTESYTGCYKDKTTFQSLECRYFASFYFLFRVVYLSCLFFAEYSYVWLALMVLSILICLLFALIQPYKCKWLNMLDTIFFALAAVGTLLYAYDIHIARIPLWVPNSLVSMPLLYFLSFMSYKIFARIKRCLAHCRAGRQEDVVTASGEQRMFERERGVNENTPLISPLP